MVIIVVIVAQCVGYFVVIVGERPCTTFHLTGKLEGATLKGRDIDLATLAVTGQIVFKAHITFYVRKISILGFLVSCIVLLSF